MIDVPNRPPMRDAPGGDPSGVAFGWRFALGLYAVFVAGVVAATWPLIRGLGSQLPYHHDPRIFAWVMAQIARRLVSHPTTLFQGNAFYPYGLSLAFNEKLLPQALLGFPGFLWGNAVLTYNLLLITVWPLSGLTMAWVAHALTRSRAAAALAGAMFCLSPYFTEYHLNFQMLQTAALPVAMLAWVRWLETQKYRWPGVALLAVAYQALSTLYYTVILSIGLITLSVGVLALRWRGWAWRRDALALALGVIGLGALLLPLTLPYLTVRRELGFERHLEDTVRHRANWATFIAAGGRSLISRSGSDAETSAFVGWSGLALAATGLVWLRRDPPLRGAARWLGRGLQAGLLATAPALAWAVATEQARQHFGPFTVRPRIATILYWAAGFGMALLLLRGWTHARGREPRTLTPGDWVRLLLLVAGVFAVLALGPTVYHGGHEAGHAPYAALYRVFPPLHAVRILVRFTILTTASLALLAAFGLRVVEDRLRDHSRLGPGPWRLFLVALFVVLGLEYAVRPIVYDQVPAHGRPIDHILRADPDDVVVLEWPTWFVTPDSEAMLQSLIHGKRVVNGMSGFSPESLHELSGLLSQPGPPFPVPEAQAALRRIYPLRYIVARMGDREFDPRWRPQWLALRRDAPAVLRFRGTYGTDDLFEVRPTPEEGWEMERLVAYDFLQSHPVLALALRPRATGPDLDQWIEVQLNEHPVRDVPINEPVRTTIVLVPPFRQAAPNEIRLKYGYRRPAAALDARYRIGHTGALSPGDLSVTSAGQPYGSEAAIVFNGTELSPQRRGYNVVAVGPAGRDLRSAWFDTFLRPEAAGELATWIAALPAGTVVAGAVKDEASSRLTQEAVRALETLGLHGDLRGHFRESHAFVGVKGAPPGSALEAIGPGRLVLSVGRPEHDQDSLGRVGIELTDFALQPRSEPR